MWETVWLSVTELLFLSNIALKYRGHCSKNSEGELMFLKTARKYQDEDCEIVAAACGVVYMHSYTFVFPPLVYQCM